MQFDEMVPVGRARRHGSAGAAMGIRVAHRSSISAVAGAAAAAVVVVLSGGLKKKPRRENIQPHFVTNGQTSVDTLRRVSNADETDRVTVSQSNEGWSILSRLKQDSRNPVHGETGSKMEIERDSRAFRPAVENRRAAEASRDGGKFPD